MLGAAEISNYVVGNPTVSADAILLHAALVHEYYIYHLHTSYNYKSFAFCNFDIPRILLMRTRCSSATSATEDITSTALDSKRSPAVDRHSLLYNILKNNAHS